MITIINRETNSNGTDSTVMPPWALALIAVVVCFAVMLCVAIIVNAVLCSSTMLRTRRRQSIVSQRSSVSWRASQSWDILPFSSHHKERPMPQNRGSTSSETVNIAAILPPPPAYVLPPDYQETRHDVKRSTDYGDIPAYRQ